MTAAITVRPETAKLSVAKAWSRALELTASITRHPLRVLTTVVEERAAQSPDVHALLSEQECFTYASLLGRANQYARWALDQGIEKGDTVCLIMPNRPEYVAIWLGINMVGGVVALLNTNISGHALAHCIGLVAPRQIIVDAQLAGQLDSALTDLRSQPPIWIHGSSDSACRLDTQIDLYPEIALGECERRPVTTHDRALYIYTSGTTGLPKAANVSHARLMQWSGWFAGMMNASQSDRLYDCLPMYHSVGGVLGPGAMLVAGGSVVIGRKFSANSFWKDVTHWNCTLIQYIGELCRYLLHAAPFPSEGAPTVRLACGNGLSPEVWEAFKTRFGIPQILEFYAATEGGLSLFNVEGKCGAIGRVPPYLAHRYAPVLIQLDADQQAPARNEQGFCRHCASNQVGEAISQIVDDPSHAGLQYEGYTSQQASEQKLLRNVFQAGDTWLRSGDLMRKDEQGFFYFVDRIGDTFRWKGENVSTLEVAQVLCAFPGVQQANVYGVLVPQADGRAGMAALVADQALDLHLLHEHLGRCLPTYAHPLFLRLQDAIEVTGTFKYTKTELMRQGYDPSVTADPLYVNDPASGGFVPIDQTLYDRILCGGVLRHYAS